MPGQATDKPNIGLLAFQGAYLAHMAVFKRLGASTTLVRYESDLDSVDAIVAPGGESTTMLKLLKPEDFRNSLVERVRGGLPYFGTCAGVILAAREVLNPVQESLDLIDITVERNAYGTQVDSFVADFPLPRLGIDNFHGVFIRAPIITRLGRGIDVLAEYGGNPVLIRRGNMLLATFHPELSGADAVHEYFLNSIVGK